MQEKAAQLLPLSLFGHQIYGAELVTIYRDYQVCVELNYI